MSIEPLTDDDLDELWGRFGAQPSHHAGLIRRLVTRERHARHDETELALDPGRAVRIDYTNWRGERSSRVIIPVTHRWGSNEWHPDEQWLLDAHDVAKNAERTFACKDIHSWVPVTREELVAAIKASLGSVESPPSDLADPPFAESF